MNAQATAKLQSILNAIAANEGRIEDDHNSAKWLTPAYLFAVADLTAGDQVLIEYA